MEFGCYAAIDKISTDTKRRAVPLPMTELMDTVAEVYSVVVTDSCRTPVCV